MVAQEALIWPGNSYPLGATYDGAGTNFALFSEVAERVELCLFDDDGTETAVELREVRRVRLARLPAGREPGPALRLPGARAVRPRGRAALQPGQAAARPVREGDRAAAVDWDEAVYGYPFGDPDSATTTDSAPHDAPRPW